MRKYPLCAHRPPSIPRNNKPFEEATSTATTTSQERYPRTTTKLARTGLVLLRKQSQRPNLRPHRKHLPTEARGKKAHGTSPNIPDSRPWQQRTPLGNSWTRTTTSTTMEIPKFQKGKAHFSGSDATGASSLCWFLVATNATTNDLSAGSCALL